MYKERKQVRRELKLKTVLIILAIILLAILGTVTINAESTTDGTATNEQYTSEVNEELPDPEDDDLDINAILESTNTIIDGTISDGTIEDTDDNTGDNTEDGSDGDSTNPDRVPGSTGVQYCEFVGFRDKENYETFTHYNQNYEIIGTKDEKTVYASRVTVESGSTNKKYPSKAYDKTINTLDRISLRTEVEKSEIEKELAKSELHMENAGYWYEPISKQKYMPGDTLKLTAGEGTYWQIQKYIEGEIKWVHAFCMYWVPYKYTINYKGLTNTESVKVKYNDFIKIPKYTDEVPKYTVKYNTNGAAAIADATYKYSFDCWQATTPGGTKVEYKVGEEEINPGYLKTDTAKHNSNVTLKPKWDKGEGITLPTPTKKGYTFVGWNDGTKTLKAGTKYIPSDDVTLVAEWKIDNYTITFNAQGATLTQNTKTVTYGGTYGELPVPTKQGYKFLGWFTTATGGTQVTKDTKVQITANQTLYAQWEETKGKITSTKYEIKEDKYITKIKPKTNRTQLESDLKAQGSYKLLKNDGTEIGKDGFVGTGCKLKFTTGETYELIVTGDVTGDGTPGITDLVKMKHHVIQKEKLQEIYEKAGDVDNNSKLTITDIAKIKRVIIGLESL